MTTRELINALLDSPMDEEVKLYIEQNHTDEYGIECSGWLFPIDNIEYKVLIKFTDWRADRKDEPSSSEKPNNCEHITEDGVTCAKYPACDDCPDNPLNKVKGSERLVKGSEQTKPTISKMEQVDKDINVRSKDEPQIQLTARCLNCNNAKACKEKHWDGCVYEPKDEKTCETCRHWKYIAHEWQCEACKCQGYEPKDEPQTDTEIAKAIVHKMIDDAVIAEDAYPDLRQKMHDAVDEYEPQTDCAWK